MVRSLAGAGVTANQVTMLACVLSIGLGIYLCLPQARPQHFLALPAFLFLRMALNAVDGMLAREFHQKSQLGAYLNELTDVVSDSFLYLPFALLPGFSPLWVGAVIVLSVVSEMAGVLGQTVGATRRYDGPMGKSDRAFWFGVMALWLGTAGSVPGLVAQAFPIVVTAMVTLTIANRVRNGLNEASTKVTR
jgi:CDP-diacylglycerol--glycerol-3-phosphate 3-phosphatidyltransferase